VSAFRSRRLAPPSAEGRWTLVPTEGARGFEPSDGRSPKRLALQGATTKWAAALTQQLLARHGVITREGIAAESFPGGFGIVYPVLKGMEEHGRIRRGYFVAGLGATQFALPGFVLPESLCDRRMKRKWVVLAATDPANSHGARRAQNGPPPPGCRWRRGPWSHTQRWRR
jgi:ATP-dependent Lhr-like helicase